MPHGGNFNPEWGYLAPRPGFIRTLRAVLLAGAIGTVAGMAVAVALVARPAADVSVAARTMAQPSVSLTLSKSASANDQVLQDSARHVASPQLPTSSGVDDRDLKDLVAAESRSTATIQQHTSVAALAEAPAWRDDASDTSSEAAPVSSPKGMNKKAQVARAHTPRNDSNFLERKDGGPLRFLPLIGRTILGANPFWND